MIVLRVIAVAGIISIAMIAPNALIILKPLLKDKKYTASSYVNRTLDNLQRQELVDFDVRNGVRFYKLTQKGEEQLLKNDIFSIKFFRPKKWDGKWRIVSFDIFEDQRWKRDVLRSYMSIGFSDRLKKFEKAGVKIFGVSADSVDRHVKFCEKESLTVDLLSDESKKMIEKYGVWVEKSMYGKKYMGIPRESFLIGQNGKVIKHWNKVKPVEHPQEVLEYIHSL